MVSGQADGAVSDDFLTFVAIRNARPGRCIRRLAVLAAADCGAVCSFDGPPREYQ